MGELEKKKSALSREYADKLETLSAEHITRQQDHRAEINELLATEEGLRRSIAVLQAELASLQQRHDDLVQFIQRQFELRQELEKTKVDREARISEISEPLSAMRGGRESTLSVNDERKWLDKVSAQLAAAEFVFPKRLLYAFHTSLKIAYWAPITVLAGVSGTGKSELPRLYARYGGLRFLSVPVQPNWDSPQDLFGFFNYMDGRYKATEFLRALAESQAVPIGSRSANDDHGYGFSDGLLLVLLDEMNLARIELYFSELLSRLESRRGDDGAMQELPIDIGAGVAPYALRLGDNVLYTGTMNEDETTQTLSDKVLDRGNIITFPRPHRLAARKRSDLGEPSEFLPRATWKSWLVPPERVPQVLTDAVHQKIVEGLQGINTALGLVDRAIGHRVFQAIEYYIANHPLLRKPERDAGDERWQEPLEDEIAQKVMPKLRGIEASSGRGRQCLDEIERILRSHAPGLEEDFKRARQSSQGAFVWNSADYLQQESGS